MSRKEGKNLKSETWTTFDICIKGWSPPTYNGKIWCHQTYMSDGSYDNAKSIWESMQNQ